VIHDATLSELPQEGVRLDDSHAASEINQHAQRSVDGETSASVLEVVRCSSAFARTPADHRSIWAT